MDNEAPKLFTWKVKVFVSSAQKMEPELWERLRLCADGCRGTKQAPRVHPIKNIYIWGPGSVRFVCVVFYSLHRWGQKHHCVGLIWSWITRSLHSSALHLSLFGCKCWSICLSVSAAITSATPCLPLAVHSVQSAQQKGIKRGDWLDPSSSRQTSADLSAFSSTRARS